MYALVQTNTNTNTNTHTHTRAHTYTHTHTHTHTHTRTHHIFSVCTCRQARACLLVQTLGAFGRNPAFGPRARHFRSEVTRIKLNYNFRSFLNLNLPSGKTYQGASTMKLKKLRFKKYWEIRDALMHIYTKSYLKIRINRKSA